jgi:acetyltransferase-like isoleucine patch superfamily enzyme/dTDP-4-dehydrorhamnose 3,5-epimerase-like enzyme
MKDVFIHPAAICETVVIGSGTRIWAFSHILSGARIGRDCNICDGVFIENDVAVGDRVTVKCGVQLWDGVVVEDDVFIGPNATFTNDPFPRSKMRPQTFLRTVLRRGASIGANATILPGLEIGPGAMVSAGAVVTQNVPANAIVVGNPARISGYVQTVLPTDQTAPVLTVPAIGLSREPSTTSIGVGGCTLHQLRFVEDMRGNLAVGEFEREIPFFPKRYFLVFDVPTREIRGEHAHKRCQQFLVCVRGSCQVLLDDGSSRREIKLDRPNLGIFLPPMVWGAQYNYSADAMLAVFASEYYDPDEYIRGYGEFCTLAAKANASQAR